MPEKKLEWKSFCFASSTSNYMHTVIAGFKWASTHSKCNELLHCCTAIAAHIGDFKFPSMYPTYLLN